MKHSHFFKGELLRIALVCSVGLTVALPSVAQKLVASKPDTHAAVAKPKARSKDQRGRFTGVDSMWSLKFIQERLRVAETNLADFDKKQTQVKVKHASQKDAERYAEKIKKERKVLSKTLNYWRARQHYVLPRAYPNDKINWKAYEQARAHQAGMPVATLDMMKGKPGAGPRQPGKVAKDGFTPQSFTGTDGAIWQSIGPRNMLSPFRTFFGPGASTGRMNLVEFDPSDQRTLYAGAASGGLWRSQNNGSTWTPLTDNLPNLGTSSLAIDPTNRNVLYLGTGDYDGGDLPGIGLMISKDFGATWAQISEIPADDAMRCILMDPANPRSMLVATGYNGVWRLTVDADYNVTEARQVFTPQPFTIEFDDDGNLITFLLPGRVSNIVYNRAGQRGGGGATGARLYVSVDNEGVYSSDDNGETWQGPIANGLIVRAGFDQEARVDIAASAVEDNRLFVLSDAQKTIFRSNDQGLNLSNINSNFPSHDQFGDFAAWSQSFYDFYIRAGAASVKVGNQTITNDVVYIGLVDLYQGRPNPQRPGTSMTWKSVGLSRTSSALLHVDMHALAFNPRNHNDMLVGSDGGVFRYTFSPSNGVSRFASLNSGITVTQFYTADWGDFSAGVMLGGTQDNGTVRPVSLTNWRLVIGGDGAGCAINPDNNNNQYGSIYPTGTTLNVTRTDTNWSTSVAIPVTIPNDDGALFIPPLAMDKVNPNIIYTGSTRLWRYTSTGVGAGSWAEVNDSFSTNHRTAPISAISVSRYDNRVVYMGRPNGQVWIYYPLPNDPQNRTLFANVTGNLPRRYVQQVLSSSSNPMRVYVVLGGTGAPNVWKTENILSRQWTNISGQDDSGIPTGPSGLPSTNMSSIAIGPSDDESILFVGTDLGVFTSNDGGQSWARATGEDTGMANADTRAMTFVPTTGYLQAATYGRGMYRVKIGDNLPIIVQPLLQSYVGDRSKLTMTVELWPIGAGPQRPIERKQVQLTPAGWAYVNLSYQGSANMYVTVPRFLRKFYGAVLTTQSSKLSENMIAGDVNGDNVINAADRNAVIARLGQYVGAGVLEDVNGNGRVDGQDLDIVTRNLGRSGD